MKQRLSAILLMLIFTVGAAAQSVDTCAKIIRAWEIDVSLREYMRTHTCECPNPRGKPVCEPINQSNNNPEPTPAPKPSRPQPIDVGRERRLLADDYRRGEEARYTTITEQVRRMLKPWLAPTAFVDPYRVQTERRIRELNCGASLALRAARTLKKADLTIDGVLDRDLEIAAADMQKAFGAGEGLSLGDCPQVTIAPPVDTGAAEDEPQIRFYRQILHESRTLVEEVAKTKSLKVATKVEEQENKTQIEANNTRLTKLSSATPNEETQAEALRIAENNAELARRAEELRKRAEALAAASAAQEKRLAELERRFQTVSADGARAGEFL